ncbi:C-type lectin domain family 10 member A-like, partial [Bombina bombina]|uniref:C-type lectin domain family 10 member A-like n=1 Tax=Bombina bombina TaxID=8345 RepID=UPI00235A8714
STDALQSDVQSVRDAVWRLTSLVKNLQINGSAAPECPEDWKQYSLSCYYLSKDTKSWPSAKKFCESKSSHLVTINTREEQNYLQGLKPGEFVWIGLTDVDGHWKWVDGTNYETALKYWKEGQPDEYFGHGLGGGEDCAHLLHNGEWNDEHCSRPYFYICENNILSKP